MYITNSNALMQIFDTKAILGISGTLMTGLATWFNELLQVAANPNIGWWIPLIPAIPTALYMSFRAWEKYNDITDGKKDS